MKKKLDQTLIIKMNEKKILDQTLIIKLNGKKIRSNFDHQTKCEKKLDQNE